MKVDTEKERLDKCFYLSPDMKKLPVSIFFFFYQSEMSPIGYLGAWGKQIFEEKKHKAENLVSGFL